jgi:ABC-type multidrug transport system permease subunit
MKRWHPLWQLFLARIREFYREPSVLFWVYGFPLFLAIGLGVAFTSGLPVAPADGQGSSEVDMAGLPGGRYIDYLIPGLMGLNLMGGGLWGVGYVIVDMRVRKLLKLYLAMPMRRSDFLLSILASRLVLLVPEMLLLALAGRLLFGVPIRGNLGTLTLVILVGGATFAGLGLVLASRTEKTETVTGLINLLMIPMWMFSGTFFPPTRFPSFLQPLIDALPLTHLNIALRDVLLQGAGLTHVAGRLVILAAWSAGSFVLALTWFRWR